MVADAVKVPVITGGGIGDARGVLAALALGADGIYMGTRFMVTRESESHPRVKESVVKGEDACTVTLPKDIMLARDLSNAFTKHYLEMRRDGASPQELNAYLDAHSQYHGQHLGQVDDGEVCCGQVAGLIDGVKGAEEIIEDIAKDIGACFEDLGKRVTNLFQQGR
jgi:NAD(P)H-dependent flavin oxidoreductase YrpB (nitropropane dioxygenase family)